ncbi:MAG: hypothetical protein V4590_09735 [Bacteroidota bacterium]
MKYVFIFLTFLFCVSVHAQRLYLHDMENGNYKSYDIGDNIKLTMKGSDGIIEGTITSFQKDGFKLNDSLSIKISEIAALVKPGGGTYTVGRVLLIILGSYMVLTGTAYVIGGLFLTIEYPPAGIAIAIIGAGMGFGGYAIINRQIQKARNKSVVRQEMDNVHYRLYIE